MNLNCQNISLSHTQEITYAGSVWVLRVIYRANEKCHDLCEISLKNSFIAAKASERVSERGRNVM